jgi:geranylgeranyl pyrophosphate synthase
VRGEDLHEGKITYPVARGMTLIQDRDVRRKFYDTLKTKPDYPVVAELINTLNSVGAIDKSVEDAEVMVDNAWKDVDKYIPDSFYKIMLRSFGMYVLQRHY